MDENSKKSKELRQRLRIDKRNPDSVFALRVNEIRSRAKISTRMLASYINIDVRTIYRVLSGDNYRYRPSRRVIFGIIEALIAYGSVSKEELNDLLSAVPGEPPSNEELIKIANLTYLKPFEDNPKLTNKYPVPKEEFVHKLEGLNQINNTHPIFNNDSALTTLKKTLLSTSIAKQVFNVFIVIPIMLFLVILVPLFVTVQNLETGIRA